MRPCDYVGYLGLAFAGAGIVALLTFVVLAFMQDYRKAERNLFGLLVSVGTMFAGSGLVTVAAALQNMVY